MRSIALTASPECSIAAARGVSVVMYDRNAERQRRRVRPRRAISGIGQVWNVLTRQSARQRTANSHVTVPPGLVDRTVRLADGHTA